MPTSRPQWSTAFSLGLCLTLLGCQSSSPVGGSAIFQLGALMGPNGAQQAPSGSAVAQGVPAGVNLTPGQALTLGGSGGGASSAAAAATVQGGGAVTIDLSHALQAMTPAGHFRVLATPADVDHMIVTLAMPGQPTRVQIVTMAQITAGQSSVTFTGLPTGTSTISITAYDVYGDPIGTLSQDAAITSGQNTTVDMNVPIDPSASPSSSGSGTVSIDVNFVTPPSPSPTPTPVPAGTILKTFRVAGSLRRLFEDNKGHIYDSCMVNPGAGMTQASFILTLSRMAAFFLFLLTLDELVMALFPLRLLWPSTRIRGISGTGTR